jgi:hypothetical protein
VLTLAGCQFRVEVSNDRPARDERSEIHGGD